MFIVAIVIRTEWTWLWTRCRRSSMVWYQWLRTPPKHEEASLHPRVRPTPAASVIGPQSARGRLGLRRRRWGQRQWQRARRVCPNKSSYVSRSIRSLRARIVVPWWQKARLSGRKGMGRAGLRHSGRPHLQDENTAASFFGKRGFLWGKFGDATYSSAANVTGRPSLRPVLRYTWVPDEKNIERPTLFEF